MIKYKDMKNKSIQLVYVALFFMATAMISLCMVGCDEGGIDSQVNGDPRVGQQHRQATQSVHLLLPLSLM